MPEPSADPQERRDARRAARARTVRRRRITAVVVLAALVAGVVAALAVAGGGGSSPDAATGPSAAAPTSPAPATTAQPPAATPPKGTVRVAVVGDIVMGTPDYGLPPDGGASFFSSVAPLLTGNVVLGNLEGTLATGGSSKCGAGSSNCYAFHTPPSYARWLKGAGFTVMNLANNHALDFGPEGQRQTVAALDRVGILHTGRPGEVARTRVHGLRVALLGFAPYSWADPLTDIPKARRIVAAAAKRADVVIVMAHAGAEGSGATHVRPGTEFFLGENRGDPEAFAHAVVDAGADLVVMSGPHVMRGMEFRKGRLIAYSMGNFAGYKVFGLGGTLSTSGVLQVTLAGDGRFVSGRLRPTQLVGPGTPAPGGSAISLVSQLSREDLGATAARIGADGSIRRPS
jgi:hypothetical protein